MHWLKLLFDRLFRRPQKREAAPYRTQFIEGALPKRIDAKTIYVIQEDGFLEHVSLICPCGCGETLHLNLLQDERPYWNLMQHQNGTVSLRPSIWRKYGCYSHFWILSGYIHWYERGVPP